MNKNSFKLECTIKPMTINTLRKTAPALQSIERVKLLEPEKYLLDNGVPVYLIDAGTQELCRIELVYDAGSFYQSQVLQAYFTNKCLTEGTESFTAKTIAETIDFYGAYLKSSSEKDLATISLYSLNKHLDKLLPVLHEIALKPTFPENEVETIVRKQHQEFLVNMDKVSFIARHKFSQLIFGENHPYGQMAAEGDYTKVDSKLLGDYFAERYLGAEFTIIVSGRVPEKIIEKLNQYFGKHPITQKHGPQQISAIETIGQKDQFIAKDGALQSALRLGNPTFNKLHPDYLKFKVVNTIFGGYFGSRLMTNIREDKGYTYGIGSGIASLRHAGMFFIASEVGTDVTQKAMDEIYFEIDKMHAELVPDEELSLVKNYMAGSFLRSADGPFALAELFKGVFPYGMNMSYYSNFLDTIKNITAEEIQDLAVSYLQKDEMVKLVVGENSI
jgi:predicted Zn-dependent peptidase